MASGDGAERGAPRSAAAPPTGEPRTSRTGFLPALDQFSGCMIGQALGDALGFPVEGYPRGVCRRYVERFLGSSDARPEGRPPFPFGQYTDDTQLARELMRSLVEREGFDPADYGRRIAALFSEDRVVGRGRATSEAAERLAGGTHWSASGTPPPSAGNGSAMRAAPVGLFFWDAAADRQAAAQAQGVITHRDPRCSAGAVAIAGAVSLALRGGTVGPDDFLGRLALEVEGVDGSFAGYLHQLTGWANLPVEQAVERIGALGMDPRHSDGWSGISPFVVGSVLWSLYAFLASPDDYLGAVRIAIEVGGDVDTTAAMTGAISGARLGLSRLPMPLAQTVGDRGTWGYHELVELAALCHGLAVHS